MKLELYNALYSELTCSEDISRLCVKYYPKVSYDVLVSIYSQKYQAHVKKTMHVHRRTDKVANYLNRYENGEDLISIAENINFPPCLLARIILEQKLSMSKQEVSACIKDPSLIRNDERLRTEVQICLEQDEHYSPFIDRIRQSIGLEYEYILQEKLHNLRIPFQTEYQLRDMGFARTPDIKLLLPIAVEGRIVNWIDSKAMFGDEHTHQIHLRDQLHSYVNRFGSGMVIYWFDFVDTIKNDDDNHKDIIIISSFPTHFETLQTSSISLSTPTDMV